MCIRDRTICIPEVHEVGLLSNGFGKDSTVGDPCERVVKEYFTIAEEKTGIFAGLYCFL